MTKSQDHGNVLEHKTGQDQESSQDLYDAEFVTSLFDEMSQTYGLVNSISSFGFCFFWRVKCARLCEYSDGDRVLDLMSGMAELSITINKRNPNLEFITIDLSSAMCELAAKSSVRNKLKSCEIINGDALHTSLVSQSVDRVVSTFGLKTFSKTQLEALAKEAYRVLKPGGRVGFLEISVPTFPPLRLAYMFYLRTLIPVIGRIFMGNPDNYRLLGVYTYQFQNCDDAIEIFRNVGFEIKPERFFFGCATGFSGFKPKADD